MYNNPDQPNLDLLAQINQDRQSEIQRLAREEAALRALNLAPERFAGLKAGVAKARDFLWAEAKHFANLLRFPLRKRLAAKPQHR